MKVETVEIELGVVQNIGDYSNVRPTMKLIVSPEEGETLEDVIRTAHRTVVRTVHNMVDDELEKAGLVPKYTNETLYQVHTSSLRKCILITMKTSKPPQEKTWQYVDSWSRDYNKPSSMRYAMAKSVAALEALENPEFVIVDCSDGNFAKLPPLPDPGPEPLWSKKKIGNWLRNWHIEESEWDEIAALEWVDDDYLRQVNIHTWSHDDRLGIVRENRLAELLKSDDEDTEDYDDEDVAF